MSDDTAVSGVAAPAPLRVDVAQISDVGLIRSENQDFAVFTAPMRHHDAPGSGRLMVVADGMGGHRGGATASRLAGTMVRDEFAGAGEGDPAERLRQAMVRANRSVYEHAQANADLRGMGTTCSALAICGDQAYIAHVGDSRIYLIRKGEIRQLTDDHSLVASMVREGLLTSQEAEVHPRRNVLQRSMGVTEDVEVDVLEPMTVFAGDTFILCSDGLHGLVRSEELLEFSAGPVHEVAETCVRTAIERGAPDNVTVIVARVEEGTIDDAADSGGEAPSPKIDPNKTTEKYLVMLDDEAPAAEAPQPEPAAEPAPVATPPPVVSADPRPRRWPWILVFVIIVGGALLVWSFRTGAPPFRRDTPTQR